MRAVVIGHKGLIGSAVASHFRAQGVEVGGVDRQTYGSVVGQRSDLVVNAGGTPDKRLVAQRPLDGFRANVEDVVRAVLELPCGLFVHISTASVYPHPEHPSLDHEDVAIDPVLLPPYGCFKYMAELVVRSFAPRWLILRLGPVIGPGLRRNAIFDLLERHNLFISPASELSYIDSRTVARAIWDLRDRAGEIYNVAGRGTVRLADVAQENGIALAPALWDLPTEQMEINVDKALRLIDLPMSATEVGAFAAEWRASRAGVQPPPAEPPGSRTSSPSSR